MFMPGLKFIAAMGPEIYAIKIKFGEVTVTPFFKFAHICGRI